MPETRAEPSRAGGASCIEMNYSKENTFCSHAFTCRHISILGTLFLLLRDVVASDRGAWEGCFSRWRVGCSVVNIPSFWRVYRAINLCQVNLFASLFDAKVERFIFGVDKVFRNLFVAKLRQDFWWRNCVVVIIYHNQSLPPPPFSYWQTWVTNYNYGMYVEIFMWHEALTCISR